MNPSAIATGQLMVSNRLIEPLSEWALIGWSYRTALPEILDIRITKSAKDRFYRISNDLMLARLDKSKKLLSYQKMLGQLLDAGNTVTLAHYLDLLKGAGMVAGLQKFSGTKIRQRGSSPKLQVLNTALMSATHVANFEQTRTDGARWGRLVESAVGAHLLNSTAGSDVEITYWREGGMEVDFVLQRGTSIVALEVKSGAPRHARSGLAAFRKEFAPRSAMLIGEGGMPLKDFF
jgi:predicted AAA+ superfamily ATPase